MKATAVMEAGLALSTFPRTCPFTPAEVLLRSFPPGP